MILISDMVIADLFLISVGKHIDILVKTYGILNN